MKKSQIVLGASAFILAIAAAFTSKAKASSNVATFITISGARVGVPFPNCNTVVNKNCTIQTAQGFIHTVYIETAGTSVKTLQKPL